MATAREIAVLREFERRTRARGFDLDQLLTPWQQRIRKSKAKSKALIAGRRSGKTDDVAKEWLDGARAGESCLYSTMTRSNAKEIIWEDLVRLNEEFSLGGRVREQALRITFPRTRGLVALAGVNNAQEVGKARGKKWHRVAIDECQSIPEGILKAFIEDALRATLMDFGGELRLSGTRPAIRAGYWFKIISGLIGKYELHQATVRDNPMLPSVLAGRSIEDILREVREEQGWSDDNPTYRREFLNEDVEDPDSLLFEFNDELNVYDELPAGRPTAVLGIDQGVVDEDAVAAVGWWPDSPVLYLLEEFIQAGQDVTDLANATKPMRDRHHPVAMVLDEGGLGKKSAEEIRNRHGLPVEAAEKSSKGAYIKLFNADMRKGLFKVPRGSRFAQDARLVQKDPKALVHGKLQENPKGFHSNILDAALYAWRRARHYTYREPVKDERTEEDKMQERLRQETEQAEGLEWWER